MSADGEIILNQRILGQFDSGVLDFINEISERILKDYSYRPYPELIAMAFWMRKANITKIREEFEADKRDRLWDSISYRAIQCRYYFYLLLVSFDAHGKCKYYSCFEQFK